MLKNYKIKSAVTVILFLALTSVGFVKTVRSGKNPSRLLRYNSGHKKIWLRGTDILIADSSNGIFIYDAADPVNPVRNSFIPLEDNIDMAVKGDYLYADSGSDLLVYDISDKTNPVLVYTLPDLFYLYGWLGDDTFGGEDDYSSNPILFGCGSTSDDSAPVDYAAATSQGGSMARFSIHGDYLYCINSGFINIIDISTPTVPVKTGEIHVSFNIETLYVSGDYLFIGSTTGMFIYSLTNPEIPAYVSEFSHATACDPVVVNGNYAFITLRGGSTCGGASNQLDVVDISDMINPVWKTSFGLTGPYGLAVDDLYVYVCDGLMGVRIIDRQNIDSLSEVTLISYIGLAYDVILSGNLLYISSDIGLFIYDVADVSTPLFKGSIIFTSMGNRRR